jgi:uncharacterized protein with ATP-grasp and redox domains
MKHDVTSTGETFQVTTYPHKDVPGMGRKVKECIVKIALDCYPCFLRQGLEASRIAGGDEKMQAKVLQAIMTALLNVSQEETPPHIGWLIHRTVREVTGNPDPYRDIKKIHNEEMLGMEADLVTLINESSLPLVDALKLAGTGNLIDMGPERRWSTIGEIFEDFTQQGTSYFDYSSFEKYLGNSGTLLYIGDNAGEIVLDKILISFLIGNTDLDITYAVRGKPVINDATAEDARFIGMTDIVPVIDTGADFPGVVLKSCSVEFLDRYYGADMILAKGQGNYESLSDEPQNIFFLLQAKCPLIARKIGCNVGDMVLRAQPRA